MKLVYLRPNGELATNAIVQRVNEYGEVMFLEILAVSNIIKGGLKLKGKDPYKRVFVQRVYPNIKEIYGKRAKTMQNL